jgi:hypothetical protein
MSEVPLGLQKPVKIIVCVTIWMATHGVGPDFDLNQKLELNID